MKKNYIVWKRTLCSSLAEILCPVALMLILSLARLAIDIEEIPERSNLNQSKIFYPNFEGEPAKTLNEYVLYQQQNYGDFYEFSDLELKNHLPLLNFIPISCTARTQSKERSLIGIAPNNSITWAVAQQFQDLVDKQRELLNDPRFKDKIPQNEMAAFKIDFQFKAFDSHDQINEYLSDPEYEKDKKHQGICFAFSVEQKSDNNYDVQISFNDRLEQLSSEQSIPSQLSPAYSYYTRQADEDSYFKYTSSGFTFLQNWISNAVLKEVTGDDGANIALSIVPMKSAAYVQDNFALFLQNLFPFFILLMYILPVYRTLFRIIKEKETKARESMRMMGLSDFAYWLSWFSYYFIVVTILSILSVIVLSINVISYSNIFLIFLFLWLFGISVFGFVIIFQAIFSKARTGAITGTLFYFGTSFLDIVVKDPNVSQSSKVAAAFLPTVAIARGSNSLAILEQGGVGLNFDNMYDTIENFQFRVVLIMMPIAFIVFCLIGLYLDNVIPSEFGRKKPWYFFVSPKYWGCKKTQKSKIKDDLESLISFEEKVMKPENFEPPGEDLTKLEQEDKVLKISDLKKTYNSGFQAVKGLNVKMYQGQIFALLGHNGAGKTTTISMLTGLLESSSGQCEIFGMDLFQEMSQVRSFLGVCPQHDILFDQLTPEEHLEIFCDFKGVDSRQQKQEIEQMIHDVDLSGYRDTVSKNLSGGYRRKLSVAIALIGGSKFVLLDEPTAGMDLSARRKLWNMLKNYKNNRIVILTTHYMDEADILGDRIGIMAGGQLTCLGSSLFLKNKFGVGYNITMVKTNKKPNNQIENYLQEKLGQVKKLSEVSTEITFQIPLSLSYKFKDFFDEFDQILPQLSIKSYGISITTLEEVFLKVGEGEEIEEEQTQPQKQESNEILYEKEEEQDTELDKYTIANQHMDGLWNVFILHMGALFRKRFFIYSKNIKGLIIEILIPVLLVLVGFSLTKIQFFVESDPRVIEPSLYPLKQRMLVNQELVKTSDNDIQPMELIQNLPQFEKAFEITYQDFSSIDNKESGNVIQQFDEDVFNQRDVGSLKPFRYGSYFIYEANRDTNQYKVSSFVNLTSQDVSAFFPQFMYESIIKTATGDPNFKLQVKNTPFPISQSLYDRQASAGGIFVVFVVAIGFALIPASIVSTILVEREKNLKHMQLISGMNLSAYWISNYIFDILKSEIPMIITIGLLYAFSLDYEGVWVLLLLFPFGAVPFTYASSFIFSDENSAQTITIFTNFVFAGIGAIALFFLRILESTRKIGDVLVWVLKIIPSFCLTNSIMFASSKEQVFTQRTDLPKKNFAIENMGGDVLFLCIHFTLWTLLVGSLEGGLIYWLKRKFTPKNSIQPREDLELDEDVVAEEERVERYINSLKSKEQQRKSSYRQRSSTVYDENSFKVCVSKFRKVYTKLFGKPLLAVERTSFGLDFGECFALLGVNGAGKTTTFKSLTNDIEPTSGIIRINGLDVKQNFNEIRKMIGYCPQYDCIFDLMTVEEHLDYYARLKGIEPAYRRQLIDKQIKEMDLEQYRNKRAGTLSGGNKRKLSVAIAILGNPPIILLDEPSAGMDPQARRFMWSVVAKISQKRKQSSVILTTHSMEEAEALSTKMGIMVKGGVFKCFGSSQHIKNKFGTGYEIEAKIKKMEKEEYQELCKQYDIPEDLTEIPLTQCKQIMEMKDVEKILIEEIREGGLGGDLVKESQEYNGNVSVKNFLNWLNVERHGLRILNGLIEDFKQVELLEHYNDYYKLRIPKQEKSIGYVFGLIENQKNYYGISEYSVGQTTLEQIFQTFANLNVEDDQGVSTYQKDNYGNLAKMNQTAIKKRLSEASKR